MPRLLSAALLVEKNRLTSEHPWTMVFEVYIAGAPGPLLLAAYPEAIGFHGRVFVPYVVDVDDLETPTHAALVNWRVTKQNVDQQMVSLLETYWFNVVDPDWRVTEWEVDVTMPNETGLDQCNVFSVAQAVTDFYVASFDLVAEGVSLNTILPKLRYTASSGFEHLPRRGR